MSADAEGDAADADAAEEFDLDGEVVPESEYGTLYVVGIGPGLPDEMTQRARDVIRTADCVVASNLYQEFLRTDGTLPPEDRVDGDGVFERPDGSTGELVRSSMGRQVELAK